ncbi:MAG: 4Fe-4S ferredoxin [Deltaproteobacteria bacterium HGW-Deltaproteobacteria-6]|jgi:NAD-dependent dihydropyrimidine dehydrogenase PreA subunit|nr:MAG: 4Fe-4S ferredoxin [Deltaproteobacteria bacterium HGW-Deltaproteobacteria-6]
MSNIYEKLRDRLEMMATGYPATANGVEIKILRQLFSEEDADLFLKLEAKPATAGQVALRLASDVADMAVRLEGMARKGLIFRVRQDEAICYFPVPFIVGIYEFQLNNLDKPLLKDISQYYLTGLGATFHGQKTPHLRSIPINAEIVADRPIFPYDDAAAIIKGKARIAVAECFCRKAVSLYGKTCSHPLETCLQFETFADYYVENGMARYISTEEALAILKQSEAEGLVIHILNSQKVEAMCCCCSCCCGMLISLKLFPAPARAVKSNYACLFDEALCNHCGICVSRCTVGAFKMKDEKVGFHADRCIGCGLCVTTCPTDALKLDKKADDSLYTPPATVYDTYAVMSREKAG